MELEERGGLGSDPFREGVGPFIALPGHVEAVERLVHVIESGSGVARLEAGAGLGKTTVLEEALRKARHPRRRVARCRGAADLPTLWESLAVELGHRERAGTGSPRSGKALRDRLRLARRQGLDLVLVQDDAHDGRTIGLASGLIGRESPGGSLGGEVTVLMVGRPGLPECDGACELKIRLAPLSHGEVRQYLREKLAGLGGSGPLFSASAVTALHALSGGVPRALNRLAGLALCAGSIRGERILTAEVIEAVALECVMPAI